MDPHQLTSNHDHESENLERSSSINNFFSNLSSELTSRRQQIDGTDDIDESDTNSIDTWNKSQAKSNEPEFELTTEQSNEPRPETPFMERLAKLNK